MGRTKRRNQETDIIIAVDAGFDATKLIINGLEIKVPYNVLDITGEEDSMMFGNGSNFILSHYMNNKSYLVGNEARKLIIENTYDEEIASKQTILNSFDKFESDLFEINVMSCIALGLVRYSEYLKEDADEDDVVFDIEEYSKYIREEEDRDKSLDGFYDSINIYVGMALPNDTVDTLWELVRHKIAKQHDFTIVLGKDGCPNKEYHMSFEIKKECCAGLSQVRAAFFGLITNDDGTPKDETEFSEKELPVLVIDGGYKTIGKFKIARNGSIVQAESNTDFAMSNVNQRVAEIMGKEYNRADIKEYKVEELIKEDAPISYIPDGSNKSQTVNIVDIRDEVIADITKKFIDYIDEEYNHFQDIKSVIVTGGTGKVYYKKIEKFIKENRQPTKVYLTEYDFMGETVDPVFAIVVGMYKYIKASMQSA